MNANDITAAELMRRFDMQAHPENGSFIEKHYPAEPGTRAESGSIYYYVAPGERTAFHRIDCDEYWCYAFGSSLEVWEIMPDGVLTVHRLGIDEGCEPMIFLRRGSIFASRNPASAQDGTFLSCVTVPRFSYEGFEMFSEREITDRCPQTLPFFQD